MKYLLLFIIICACSHYLPKGHYRHLKKRQYVLQIDLSQPDAEKTFEVSKDEICLHFHHAAAIVINREFSGKRLVALIECSKEKIPLPLAAPRIRFFKEKKGVGGFYLKCGSNC